MNNSIEQERRRALIEMFSDALALRLSRPAGEVRARGLSAYDFPVDEVVELTFEDGSFMSLRHAFYVVDSGARFLGVFTEHLGYHCFPAPGLRVRRLSGATVLQEQHFE